MELSVIICTHNRSKELDRTLGSLTAVTPPAFAWEVLVVNNASTDGTRALLERWSAAALLPLRTMAEPELGLSHARNAAIGGGLGHALLFLDDDVDAAPGLLRAYEQALAEHPRAGYFGGPITPILEEPADQLAQAIVMAHPGVFSCQDLGPDAGLFPVGRLPFGANMCIRRTALAGRLFLPELGYVGRGGPLAEEAFLLSELVEAGTSGRWVPHAGVGHRIPRDRASWAFLEKHARATGMTEVLVESLRNSGRIPSPRLVAWYWRRAARVWARSRLTIREPLRARVALRYDAWQQASAARELSRRAWQGAMAQVRAACEGDRG